VRIGQDRTEPHRTVTRPAAVPDAPARITLIGFMGSGKSTVGPLLAGLLGWDFVDLDTLVEARAGCPVAAIFDTHGEEGFRALESLCLHELSGRSRVVIATGGGAPTRHANQWFFRDAGTAVFHLHASLDQALARTRDDASRPLLAKGSDEVHQLYETRLPKYRQLGTDIDTDGKTPEDVAAEIVARLSPRR
jgi:shikimate kinase